MEIDINYNIKSEYKYGLNGYTVAMWLAKNKVLNIP